MEKRINFNLIFILFLNLFLLNICEIKEDTTQRANSCIKLVNKNFNKEKLDSKEYFQKILSCYSKISNTEINKIDEFKSEEINALIDGANLKNIPENDLKKMTTELENIMKEIEKSDKKEAKKEDLGNKEKEEEKENKENKETKDKEKENNGEKENNAEKEKEKENNAEKEKENEMDYFDDYDDDYYYNKYYKDYVGEYKDGDFDYDDDYYGKYDYDYNYEDDSYSARTIIIFLCVNFVLLLTCFAYLLINNTEEEEEQQNGENKDKDKTKTEKKKVVEDPNKNKRE